MFRWLKKRRLYPGKVLVRWPRKDLREDVEVVDLSRLDENLVGVRRRQYSLYRPLDPPPAGGVEFVEVDRL